MTISGSPRIDRNQMNYTIRNALKADEPFLWQMLYYAAHMDESGETVESARINPALAYYVEGWTERENDLGFLAEDSDRSPIGAAWIRIMPSGGLFSGYVPSDALELAIATLPQHVGHGVGTALLLRLVEAARPACPTIALSVRANNPAKRLYERFGFATVAQITNRIGTSSHVMELKFR